MALNSHESKFKQEELIYLSQRRVGYSPTKVTIRFFIFFIFKVNSMMHVVIVMDQSRLKKTNNLKNKII